MTKSTHNQSIFIKIYIMKELLTASLGCFLLIGCNVNSQNDVPKAVRENFKKMYPGENDPDWHIDKNGYFESKFKKKGIHYRADYKSDGTWVETEQNISKKDLPKAVRKKLEKDYDYKKIYEIEKVDHPTKGIFYDVEIKIDGKKKDIEFLEDGTVIN